MLLSSANASHEGKREFLAFHFARLTFARPPQRQAGAKPFSSAALVLVFFFDAVCK